MPLQKRKETIFYQPFSEVNFPPYIPLFMSTKIVGILNVAPDSFSDGRTYTREELKNRIQRLKDDGADIIDVGAESTAPGSQPITLAEELQRLNDFFAILQDFSDTIIFSLDTKKSEVARIGIKHGISIINDVSGGRNDPAMLPLIASHPEVSLILMYCKNANGHADWEENTNPTDIMRIIITFFDERLATARAYGIHDTQIILDPGMGAFISTNPMDSVTILQSIRILKEQYHSPILIGTSRKWFLSKLSRDRWPHDRLASSLISNIYAVQEGIDYIRVHDVYEMRQALQIWEVLNKVEKALLK